MRRVHRPLQRDHRGRARRAHRVQVGQPAQAAGDLRVPRRVRDRPGQGQEGPVGRSEEHTSELQSQSNLVCRLLLEKKKKTQLYSTFSPLVIGRILTSRITWCEHLW